MRVTRNLYVRVRKSTRRSQDPCRSRNFENSPWWEMPPHILEKPSISPEGDDSVSSPVLTLLKICGCRSRVPFALLANCVRMGAVRTIFSRNAHASLWVQCRRLSWE
ncbi:unnamed protein product [Laminaria digitata]